MSTTNVTDAILMHAPSAESDTIDLTDPQAPRPRVATIDLSAFGAPLEVPPSETEGELFRLAMGDRSIHVITASHCAVPLLIELETAAAASGGAVHEFASWLADTTGAVFAVVVETTTDSALHVDRVCSFARLTVGPGSDRALREFARLLGRNPEDIINDFREWSGFANLDGLLDVTTFTVAPVASQSVRQYAEELGLLIDAVATTLMVMAGRGEASVITTSLARNEQRWLFEAGWPLTDCLNADVAEVLVGNRSRAGRSIPAWFRLHALWGAVASQRTMSLGNVATHLHRNRIDLGSCIPRGHTR